jgi:hypothetical protein
MTLAKEILPARPLSLLSVVVAGALAAFVLAASLRALTREWDKPLLNLHSFRQTQTAISTYHMVGKPGMFLNYGDPGAGKTLGDSHGGSFLPMDRGMLNGI